MIINTDYINKIDTEGMFAILKDFPSQIDIGTKAGESIKPLNSRIDNIVISGMGGSAIAGDIIKSYLEALGFDKQIYINRDYNIPNWVGENTLFVVSSYSGNTEETLSALEKAMDKTDNIIGISTGGKVTEILKENNFQLIELVPGMMPRCALGMSFFGLLTGLANTGILPDVIVSSIKEETAKTKNLLESASDNFADYSNENEALTLAQKLFRKNVVCYTGEIFRPVGLRWAGQLQENSKAHAFTNILPEMNHNEINSWDYPEENNDFSIIVLTDKSEHERVQKRANILTEILAGKANVVTYSSDAENLLSRMFEIIYFGDWVSYYLAIIKEIDPTPIPTITKLKNLMAD